METYFAFSSIFWNSQYIGAKYIFTSIYLTLSLTFIYFQAVSQLSFKGWPLLALEAQHRRRLSAGHRCSKTPQMKLFY